MKTLIAFILLTTSCFAQTVNNATVNMTGSMQNVIVTQSGSTPQSFNLNITCYSNCAANPTNVTQY